MTVLRVSCPNAAVLVACAAVLAACSGGGGDDGGNGSGGGSQSPGGNVAPVANAGSDRTVTELSTVALNGSATDANAGDMLAYAWTQVAGPAVSIADADQARATFSAPDVQTGAPEDLTFELTVTDGGGLSDTDSVVITVAEPGQTVTISGTLQYEFVPPRPLCQGLDYPMTERRPIRAATVQVIDAATRQVLGEDEASENGEYGITIPPNVDVFVRVRAELLRGGTPSWSVEVRDNTASQDSQNLPIPLSERPIYVLDTGVFDSGPLDQQRNLTATTGWSGTAYSSPRAAAPFAVLDAIYTAMQLVLEADPAAQFAPLDAFWSVNNTPAEGSGTFEENIASGEIGTSFYSGGINSLFLLGKADSDTEEFDDHVIVHEWGHYFEDAFSRSDSVGGQHGFGDRLDMRVAFGEGWATALAGITLENPQYCDTQGSSQGNGFEIDAEEDSPIPRGWFNEFSVMALIYDLWDDSPTELTRGDDGSIGFQPIFDTMTGPQRATASHTSVFSFLSHLVDVYPSAMAPVSALRTYHDIDGTGIYGANETNDSNPNGSPEDVLPVYTEIMPNGTPVNICSNRQFDSDATGNKLSEFRFLRMTVPSASRYTFEVVTDADTLAQLPPDDPTDDRDQSDPDIWYYLNGQIQNRRLADGTDEGQSGEANRETFTSAIVLQPGDYVMDILEWRHTDEQTDKNKFPARSCFDVTITPAP